MTESNCIEVHLSDAAIRNGYIDIEACHTRFFPQDAFGDRSGSKKGAAITFEADGREFFTDIRLKSDRTISPRSRFGAWFKALRAAQGDVIRIFRIDARHFRLTHVPSSASEDAHYEQSFSPKPAGTQFVAGMPPIEVQQRSIAIRSSGTTVTQGLIVADPWVDLILSGEKSWEIRGEPTRKRGPVAILRKGAKAIAGVAMLLDVVGPLSIEKLRSTNHLHAVPIERFLTAYRYPTPYAWVLGSPRRLAKPLSYRHPNGAVRWVNLDPADIDALSAALK